MEVSYKTMQVPIMLTKVILQAPQ